MADFYLWFVIITVLTTKAINSPYKRGRDAGAKSDIPQHDATTAV